MANDDLSNFNPLAYPAGPKIDTQFPIPSRDSGRSAGTSGMTPFEVSPEGVKKFTQNAYQGQNFANLSPVDFVRMLTGGGPVAENNPAAPAPAGGVPSAPAAPTAPEKPDPRKILEGSVQENGVLPWDFWNKNPDIKGGVMRVENGPTAGKIFSLVEPERQTRIENNLHGLINQWASTLSSALEKGTVNIGNLAPSMSNLTNVLQSGTKIPAEVNALNAETNLRNATASEAPARIKELEGRANYYNQGSGSREHYVTAITGVQNRLADRKTKALLAHPLYMSDPNKAAEALQPIFGQWDQEARDEVNAIPHMIRMIQQLSGGGGANPGMTPGGPGGPGGPVLQAGQRIKINPADGKQYIVDGRTNQVISEFK